MTLSTKKLQGPMTAQVKELLGTLAILFNYVSTDIQKKSRAFKIGVFSIYLVVSFLVVLQAALYLTPNIFLRLAEDESGQADFTLTATINQDTSNLLSNSSNSISFMTGLNLTEMQQKLAGVDTIAGLAPRWLLPIQVGNPDTPNETFKVVGIVLDSKRERDLGFGSNIELPDLKEQQCWISLSTSSLAGLTGDKIHLYMNILESINEIQGVSASSSSGTDANATTRAIARSIIESALTAQGARREGSSDLYLVGNNASAPIIRVGETVPNLTGVVLTPAVTPNYQVEVNASGLVEALIPALNQGLTLDTNLTVTETVESPHGKWPKALGNVVVIDSKYLVKQIEDNLVLAVQNANLTDLNNAIGLPNLTNLTTITNTTNITGNPFIDSLIRNNVNLTNVNNFNNLNNLNNVTNNITNINKTLIEAEVRRYAQMINLEEAALTVNVLLKDRGTIYASQNSVRPHLIAASNTLYSRLGKNYPATISSTLDTALQAFFIFKNFLDNIFNSTVFILILLSALLVYSLMNSNVEEKTYEFGMLRALGLKKVNLTVLLIIQSMFFAIPGLILGLIFSFTLNFMVTFYISDFVTLSNSYTPAGSALALGICIAILVPLAANVIPIRKALSKTLRDSLNIYHRAVSDVIVRIMKLAEMGISPAQTIGSVTMIVMGFLTYYLAPYAFVYQNLPMFFIILNVVMMMMVIGFTLLLNLLQPSFERFLLKTMLFPLPSEKPLESVILKNFDSHRPRNNKTSLMFSIALAFLIFSGTGFRLNSDIIAQTLRTTYGSDLTVTALNDNFLDEQKLRENLENYKRKFPGVIQDYAFGSQKFLNQPQIPTLRLSSLSGNPNQKIDIISVDRTYLNSIYEDLYVPESVDPTASNLKMLKGNEIDIVNSLYTTEGLETQMKFDSRMVLTNAVPRKSVDFGTYFGTSEVRFFIPKGLALETSVSTETPALLDMDYIIFKARIRGLASKLPGFSFSGYKTFSKYTIVTSHEDYYTLRKKIYDSITNSLEKKQTDNYIATIPSGSSYSVAKQSLYIRYADQISDYEKQKLVNTVETLVNSQFIIVNDVVGTVTTLQDSLVFIDIFFILVAFIAIALSFFFIIISFGNNIKENSWEFGVLRAIGLNKKQMTRIYVFEAVCLVLSAAILGTVVGIVVAIVSNQLFFMFTELPFTLEFPTLVFCITLVTSLITAVFGSKVAVDDVKNKQIAAIIKALE